MLKGSAKVGGLSEDPVTRETELLVAARHDRSAFGELYQALWPLLVRRLVRQTFCPDVAADIASETFARAVVRCAQFDPARGSARAWLWTIAQNELRSWLRRGAVDDRARRKIGFRVQANEEVLDDVLDVSAANDFRDVLREALGSLKPDARTVVRLRVLDDLSYREIADALGCSEGTARVRFSRAIGSLRNALADSPVAPVWP